MRWLALFSLLALTANGDTSRRHRNRLDDSISVRNRYDLGTSSGSAGCAGSLCTGLDRYYALNGDAVDSVGGINGTIAGPSPTYEAGHVSAQAMYLGASTSNKFTATAYGGGDFSVSYWVYARAATFDTFSGVIGNILADTNTKDWFVMGDGTLNFKMYENASSSTTGIYTLTATTWYHIVYTRAGTSGNLYVNGTLTVAAFSFGSAALTGSTFYIASRPDARASNIRIQDVGLWSRAITAGEVTTLYNGGAGITYPF